MNNPLKKHNDLSTADFVAGAGGPPAPESREPQPPPATQGVGSGGGAQMVREEQPAALFDEKGRQDLRARWSDIQTAFVDEPRKAVEQADSLVAQTMKRLAEIFANERDGLEKQWDRGTDISTEDLRVALQKYRSFFNRLLSM